MINKKISDLSLLEQDIWLNFCYYYQCELDDESIANEDQTYIDKKEKNIRRMQQNDFLLSELMAFRQEMMGETIPFKPFQIAELLMLIYTLKVEVSNLPAKMFQRQYSDILIAYVQLLGGLEFIQNHKLARSAKATLAVKARYDKHLYPRREIIYRILREQVVQRGKWDNPNQAVNFIIDDLIKAFEDYDVDWLQSELVLKQKKLKELEQQSKLSTKQTNADFVGIRRKPRTASTSKQIEELKKEINNLKQILKSKYPSKEMEKSKYKMPYSGGYIAETIIHELRSQPEILKEILLNAN
ncbi:hypothetical protein E0H77_08135 [Acinetobacter sp. ANC 4633]|uniref:hypothetical protein n=1 Tax=Acinetobacter sp. ANC 4633 TaxID=2529845 RepID=UPI00103A41EA|nr:hypothetical protein [Acinetobacter sp. ANC 4633]TCB25817.1 hypothetical protein E0H77_08135 [Acinetobacter sp. ANC 4633]